MGDNISVYQGCLMGLAVGDALGYSVDTKNWEQICSEYGPNGLLGYDLRNGYADVTSHTQIAAYVCNALLLSLSRRDREDCLPYITLGLKEWARSQHYYRDPERSFCWIAKLPAFRRRHCRDVRMLDSLRMQAFGRKVKNANDSPGAITEAIAIGLFFQEGRMPPQQIGVLASAATGLTHGSPETALTGVVLAYAIAGILQEPDIPLEEQFRHAIQVMTCQFPSAAARGLGEMLSKVFPLLQQQDISIREGMEMLRCSTAGECLAGAMYASLACQDDFDRAMITAVNHSGYSAAVGAVTGAILGAYLGIEALPEFYLESIEPADALSVLAEDLQCSTPASGLFDDDWDQKYVQGLPL